MTQTYSQPQITRDSLGQPETTWASESTGCGTRITLVASGGVVRRMVVAIPWRSPPAARDTLFELLEVRAALSAIGSFRSARRASRPA